jgi:hypothetical protein
MNCEHSARTWQGVSGSRSLRSQAGARRTNIVRPGGISMTTKRDRELAPLKRHLRTSALGFSALILAAASSSEVGGPGQEGNVGDETTTPGQDTANAVPQQEITIATRPDAVCKLTDEVTGDNMSVHADDEGVVHLWAAPTVSAKRFTLDCDKERALLAGANSTSSTSLGLRPSFARHRNPFRSSLQSSCRTSLRDSRRGERLVGEKLPTSACTRATSYQCAIRSRDPRRTLRIS